MVQMMMLRSIRGVQLALQIIKDAGGFCCSPKEECKRYPPLVGKKYCSYISDDPKLGGAGPCPPQKPKFCEGNNRNECCEEEDTCGVVTSSVGAESAICVGPGGNDPNCKDKPGYTPCGDYCCTPSEECVPIFGAMVCQDKPDSCEDRGLEPCPGNGYNICCPPGTCRNHPNGYPYCQYF